MAIKLKKWTAAEQAAIEKLARSRTAPAREVERARLILLAAMGKRVPAIAQELALTQTTSALGSNASMKRDLTACRIDRVLDGL
jgi:hypothetical protein